MFAWFFESHPSDGNSETFQFIATAAGLGPYVISSHIRSRLRTPSPVRSLLRITSLRSFTLAAVLTHFVTSQLMLLLNDVMPMFLVASMATNGLLRLPPPTCMCMTVGLTDRHGSSGKAPQGSGGSVGSGITISRGSTNTTPLTLTDWTVSSVAMLPKSRLSEPPDSRS